MSFVVATPDVMTAAASDLADLRSLVEAAGLAALAPTTQIQAAAADEVSIAISALFASTATRIRCSARKPKRFMRGEAFELRQNQPH